VITPRLGMILVPGTAELLSLLAASEQPSGPARPGSLAERRASRAAALVNAHRRLRPNALPPAEAVRLAATVERLRVLLGDERYAAAHAEGDGLGVDEAVALMRDVAEPAG
jgi:hypothetical protein